MAVTLYLHIGHPKCGSSTLQRALYENRRTLQKLGIGVCDSKFRLMGAVSKASFPIGTFRRLIEGTPEAAAAELDRHFGSLKKQAERQGLSAVVLSAENLASPAGIGLVAAARTYFDCKIIYYIRRQDDWLISSWLQWQFKTGLSLKAFIENRLKQKNRYLFKDVLTACLAHFPSDDIRARALFKPNLVGEDLLTDFWTALGVDPDTMVRVASQNVSFSPNLVGVLKESPYLFDGSHDNSLSKFIDSYHQFPVPEKRTNLLDNASRQKILDYFKPENHWLKTEFFEPDALVGWLRLAAQPPAEPNGDETISLGGIAEVLNLNLAMLRELREDVDKIKKALGLR